jgi:hypothetical protein
MEQWFINVEFSTNQVYRTSRKIGTYPPIREHEEVEGNLLVCSVGAGVARVGLPAVSRSSDRV